MSERIQNLKQKLDEGREYVNHVLDHVTEDQWETQVYSDGLQWTVRQIVAHIADADKGHNGQVMSIAEGKSIIPEDFDIERYNASMTRKNQDKSIAESRAQLKATREALLVWLETLDEEKLDQTGRHASLRILSIEQILSWMPEHERLHAQDIATTLGID